MATLAIAGAGLALAYKATLDEGKDAAKFAKIQQEQINRQAKSVQEAGQQESREKRKQAKRAQASQIAQMAANGGAITGSNLSILSNTSREFEADALVISRNFGVRAMELRNKGSLVRWQGRLARRSARIRGAANLGIGIGTIALLGGFSGKLPPGKSLSVPGGRAAGVGSSGSGLSLMQP